MNVLVDLLLIAAVVAAWLVLVTRVLPRLGVPT
jgi:hypothetical protein